MNTKRFSIGLMLIAAPLIAGCNTTPTQDGAVVGGALGAGLGAIVGHQSGHQGEGALIGAAAGALTGALIGDDIDRRDRRYQDQRYTQPAPASNTAVRGHYETRIVTAPNGEVYEERVFVRD